jgi:hypothetical protein
MFCRYCQLYSSTKLIVICSKIEVAIEKPLKRDSVFPYAYFQDTFYMNYVNNNKGHALQVLHLTS